MTVEAIWILLLFVTLLSGILSGAPVMFAIAGVPTLVALAATAFGHFDLVLLQAVPQRVFGIMENRLFLAVPLFVLMGILLDRSGQAERMLTSINALFGRRQSGLALAVLSVSALIAASTGIIGATIVMLGTISLPTLLRAGIDKRTASGLICASGSLGQIIPPSIVLILLGDQISNSYLEAQLNAGNFAPEPVTIANLFAGALIPGFLLVALYGAYAVFRLRGAPNLPDAAEPAGGSRAFLVGLLPTLTLIVSVLGSILAGVATPTEAAAVGAAGALLIAAGQTSARAARISLVLGVYAVAMVPASALGLLRVDFSSGHLSFTPGTVVTILALAVLGLGLLWAGAKLLRAGVLGPVFRETVLMSGMIFGIVIASSVLSLVFRGFEGDEIVAEVLGAVPGGAYGMLLITMVVIFLLGFILEFIEIIYIVIPIVGPVILATEIDPVWFAVLVAMNLQTSFLTPPFGFALFYFRSVAPPDITTRDIYRAIAPFVVLQLCAIALVAAFPALATALPELFR